MSSNAVRCRREASSRAGYGKLEGIEAGAGSMLVQQHTLMSYQELAHNVLGDAGGQAVSICMLCASIGVCSAYVVFITETTCSVMEGRCAAAGHRAAVTFPILVILILLVLLRDHRRLSFTSLLGDIAILVGTLSSVRH